VAIEDIRAEELRALIREQPEDLEIIDVREPREYEAVHIRGSRLIPLNELAARFQEIDFEKKVIFVCRSGRRSQLVANMAAATGHDVKNLRFGVYECFKDGRGEFLEGSEGGAERYFS
jgi:rhodanese-related sulfurtransferase